MDNTTDYSVNINWNQIPYGERPVVMAKILSDFVNGASSDYNKMAETMATDHRYLQQEMFKVCFAYIEEMAHSDALGRYDGRNEWACKTATKFMEALKDRDELCTSDAEYALEGKERRKWT